MPVQTNPICCDILHYFYYYGVRAGNYLFTLGDEQVEIIVVLHDGPWQNSWIVERGERKYTICTSRNTSKRLLLAIMGHEVGHLMTHLNQITFECESQEELYCSCWALQTFKQWVSPLEYGYFNSLYLEALISHL